MVFVGLNGYSVLFLIVSQQGLDGKNGQKSGHVVVKRPPSKLFKGPQNATAKNYLSLFSIFHKRALIVILNLHHWRQHVSGLYNSCHLAKLVINPELIKKSGIDILSLF